MRPDEDGDDDDVLEAYVNSQKVRKQQPRRAASKKAPPTDSAFDDSLVLSEPVAIASSTGCAEHRESIAEEQVRPSSTASPKVQRNSKILAESRKQRCSETLASTAAQITAEDPSLDGGNEDKSASNPRVRKRKDAMAAEKDSPQVLVDPLFEINVQDTPISMTRKTRRRKVHDVASEPAEELGEARDIVNEAAELSQEKKKLRKYVPRPRKVERRAVKINPADPDLDPKKMSMRDIIRLAECKDRMMRKDDAKKSNGTTTNATVHEEDVQRNSFAPQVQIIDGRIVINEESLTVSAHPKDDIRTYTRVEESHSKLNYHSYTKRTTRVNWQKAETERFYEALSEFGTNFAIIQHLFPGRTRKQIFLKFKKEEKMYPSRVSDALMMKPIECSQYFEVMNLMNLQPTETAEPEAEASQQDSLFSDVGFHVEEVCNTQSTVYTEVVSKPSKASPVHSENVKDEKEAVVTNNQPDHLETTNVGEMGKLEMKPEDKSPKRNESPVRDPVVPRKRSLFSYQIK